MMCKSAAEGGQRCAHHALLKMDDAQIRLNRLNSVPGSSEDDVRAAQEALVQSKVGYASTTQGAETYRRRLAQADNDREAAYLTNLIDEGARVAQTNRAVENAHRSSQRIPPLTTPVPKTIQQTNDEKAEADRLAAEKAVKEADPFGLRAEATTQAPPAGVGRYDDSHEAPAWTSDAEDDDSYDDDLNYRVHRTSTPDIPKVQSEITTASGERLRVESGHRKSDLKKNDIFLDAQGNMKRVVGDTGFGRLLVRPAGLRGRFSNPTPEGFVGEHITKVLERNIKN